MNTTLLISQKVVADFGPRLTDTLGNAPRQLDIVPFTPQTQITRAQLESIEVAFFSRDIWEGGDKTTLSPTASVFWNIVDHAPNLKWLPVFSAGADHNYYQASLQRGVRLTTGAGAQAESVATAAVTGLLALARRFPFWWAAQQRREWLPLRGANMPPDLQSQTTVIVGMGPIGTAIARVLQAVGMKTIGIRRRVAPTAHFDQVLPLSALDSVLPACDWLVLACPLGPETRGLIDARRLALLPRTAGLVNIARGEVVDEAALTDALSSGRLRHAYLDVFTVEPLARESPLWGLPNVLISPHCAGASTGTYARAVEIFLRNLDCYLREQPLQNELLPA